MLNLATIQGRLTRDPELRYTQGNKPVCRFTLASSETYKDTERTFFIDCVAWAGTAEFIARYFRKGQQALVHGRLGTDSWTDSDGARRSKTILTADRVYFCGTRAATEQPMPAAQSEDSPLSEDDQLPF